MKENSGNTDRMIEEVVRIAHALDGQQESDFDKTGDRLRDAIGRIANQVEQGGGSNKFIVTLTLTSEDGGTMNHTNKEIAEAFNNGCDVWFQGNMNGMDGKFPLKAITYLTGMQYPFIETEFDYVVMNHSTGIISTAKTIIAISASDGEHNVFWMKQYTLGS